MGTCGDGQSCAAALPGLAALGAGGAPGVLAMKLRLVSMGATPYQPITPRGEGFVTAAVVDPFGNVLGVMYNQHYLGAC
jgi:hypothetical protein